MANYDNRRFNNNHTYFARVVAADKRKYNIENKGSKLLTKQRLYGIKRVIYIWHDGQCKSATRIIFSIYNILFSVLATAGASCGHHNTLWSIVIIIYCMCLIRRHYNIYYIIEYRVRRRRLSAVFSCVFATVGAQ